MEESDPSRRKLISRGEDGDPVCGVCRVENKLDDDTSEGSGNETEMVQNGP